MQKLLFSVILLFGIIGVFYYISKIELSSVVNFGSTKENYNKVLKIKSNQDNGGVEVAGGEFVNSFKIDLADNPIKRELGLSYRKSMCNDCGMFFSFPREDFYSFWMKDMNFDIDIIFINSELEIVNIFPNVKKEGYVKSNPASSEKIKNTEVAMYILELNSGKAEEKNIKIGDIVILE